MAVPQGSEFGVIGHEVQQPRFLAERSGEQAQGLPAVFGVVAWAMQVGGRSDRAPLLAGLSIGVGGYAVARLLLPG